MAHRHRVRMLGALLALLLLLGGCNAKVRLVVMGGQTTTQSGGDEPSASSALKDIRSFSSKSALEDRAVEVVPLSWMDETHLWCAAAEGERQMVASMEDSFGFIKRIEGLEAVTMLGVCGGGRYLLYLTQATLTQQDTLPTTKLDGTAQGSARGPSAKPGQQIRLYDKQSSSSVDILQLGFGEAVNERSFSISPDGGFISFFVFAGDGEGQGGEQSLVVAQLATPSARRYSVDKELLWRSFGHLVFYPFASQDPWSATGYVLMDDAKHGGIVNGLRVKLDGGMMKVDTTSIASDLQVCFTKVTNTGINAIKSMAPSHNDHLLLKNGFALFLTGNTKLLSLELATGQVKAIESGVENISFSKDGTRVAYATGGAKATQIHIAQLEMVDGWMRLTNVQDVYATRLVSIGYWSEDSKKLLLEELVDNAQTMYRVLTFH